MILRLAIFPSARRAWGDPTPSAGGLGGSPHSLGRRAWGESPLPRPEGPGGVPTPSARRARGRPHAPDAAGPALRADGATFATRPS
ncbi:hypothetical protein FEF34_02550 [Streptomyces marianii]|uniref:Uncharacterized protein n=1 Tax=Streptomyces marianii TaxID=1817406 RepID=A0A5R9DXE4_9ACTN|nr:hypothetical protein FEF34_02550 [Streptomyces marianii]